MTNLSLTPGDSWIDGILEEFNWRQFVEGDDSEDIDQSSSLTVHTVAAVLRITTAITPSMTTSIKIRRGGTRLQDD